MLTPKGTLVSVGGPSDNSWLGPLAGLAKTMLVAQFVSQKIVFMLANANKDDMEVLRELMQSGKLTPVIDRRYKLSETPDAVAYVEQGHARGKVVIAIE